MAGSDELGTEIAERSEQAMRTAIGAIPDGIYTHQLLYDELDGLLPLHAAILVRGDELYGNYTGSAPQHANGGVNCTPFQPRLYPSIKLPIRVGGCSRDRRPR